MWEFRETANVGILVDGWIEYVLIVESPHAIRLAAREREREFTHSTALGKAILAYLPEHEAERIVRVRGLASRTEHTITTWEQLREALAGVRARGFALDHLENTEQAVCVGAPIFGLDGAPVAAISLSGPAWRFGLETAELAGVRVRQTADELSRLMRSGVGVARL